MGQPVDYILQFMTLTLHIIMYYIILLCIRKCQKEEVTALLFAEEVTG